MTVKNQMHYATLTVIDSVVRPRVEIAVRLNNDSSGRRHSSVVRNHDPRHFTWNIENDPLT